jgi:antitoxin component YwqK of YwqJK toxin-antitoxin module
MEQPVPYRNSWLHMIVAVATVLVGCNHLSHHVYPAVFINSNSNQLQQRQGILYDAGQPFSGFVFELFPNGDTASITSYLQGKEDGISKHWHVNKQLAETRYYNSGWKEGTHTGWWENGKIKYEYHFVNDEHEGTLTEWFSSGKVSRIFHYQQGHEEGPQKMWWDNGAIRANYYVRNGERFGYIGQKMCSNNLDSLP